MPLSKLIPDPASPMEWRWKGTGVVAQTCEREAIATTLTPTSGTVYCGAVALRRGQIINGVAFAVAATGSGITLLKTGIYGRTNRAGTMPLLAVTADYHASITANINVETLQNSPTAFVVPHDDIYYLSFLQVGSTTTTIERGQGQTPSAGTVGSGFLPYCHMTGQTDIPALLTPATEQQGIWLAATP
jgi:hypothetical protein